MPGMNDRGQRRGGIEFPLRILFILNLRDIHGSAIEERLIHRHKTFAPSESALRPHPGHGLKAGRRHRRRQTIESFHKFLLKITDQSIGILGRF
jgi:hypothetical protein